MSRLNAARARSLCSTFLCASIFVGLPAAAQEADQSYGNEIVVTALKRETSIQDTPISISAIGAQALADRGVKSVSDLGSSVPGLNFVDSGPGNRRVAIRGIQAAGEPTVGVYYDETPVTGSPGNSTDAGGSTPELRLFDVSRVEVLRGPQGTLYGSSSMGGTVRIIFNKPSYKLEGAVDNTVSVVEGGEPNLETNAMVNIPLIDQKLAFRAVGYYSRVGGYVDNVRLGLDNVNGGRSYGGRFMLRANPTDNLTFDLSATIDRMSGAAGRWQPSVGKYKVDAYSQEPVTDANDLLAATVNWDLGGVAITGNLSHANKRYSQASDVGAYLRSQRTPARCQALVGRGTACNSTQLAGFYNFVDYQSNSVTYSPTDDMKATTAELRASSTGDNWLNWTVGGFYSTRNSDIERNQVNTDRVTGRIITPYQVITTRVIEDKLEQKAGFGEVTVKPFQGLTLTGGLRVFEYKRDVGSQTLISNYVVGATAGARSDVSTKQSGSVLKFNASYNFTPDIMIYATASQGFRPGGVNTSIGLAPEFQSYGSDSLWNYEAGLKTSLLDGKLQFNVDGFQIDWSNIQVTGRTTNGAFSFVTNAGGARVRGVEADAFIRPFAGFNLSLAGSYTDAKLTENQTNASLVAAGLKGDRIPFIPKFQISGSADYVWALNDHFDAKIHLDARHVSGSYSDFRPAATYTRKVAPYELVNLRVGVNESNDNWGVAFFVNNLLDDTAITRASATSLTLGSTFVNSAPPRTYGVNFTKKF